MLLGALDKNLSSGTSVGISRYRGIGLSFLIFAFVVLEVVLPRFGGGERSNLLIFCLVSLCVLVSNQKYFFRNFRVLKMRPIIWFLLYLMWCMTSAVWSYVPVESLLHSLCYFLAFFTMVSLADVSASITCRHVVNISVAISFLSWVFLLISPSQALMADIVWRLQGIMSHCQRLGLLAGIGLIILCETSAQTKRAGFSSKIVTTSKFLTLLFTIIATKTRAFSTFIFLCISASLFLRGRLGRKLLFIILGMFLAGAIYIAPSFVSDLYSRNEMQDGSLTGRTSIWEKSIELIKMRPFLGYGFTSFYSDLTSNFFTSFNPRSGHNAWINAAFETGLVGAGLMTIFLFSGLISYKKKSKEMKEKQHFGVGFWLLILSLMCGVTGLFFGGKITTSAAITLLLVMQELYEKEGQNRKVAPPPFCSRLQGGGEKS